MRVTSDIWAHVFVRRETTRGAIATLHQKGALEAGAIYIIENLLNETFSLYGPAPQSLINDGNDDRKFETIMNAVCESKIDAYIDKQKNFDPDIWIIETQCRQGPPSISIAE